MNKNEAYEKTKRISPLPFLLPFLFFCATSLLLAANDPSQAKSAWTSSEIIELTATVFGFICVVLTIKENIWCWPAGLVQVTLFIYVYWQARLYSDMLLHIIYVPLQFYGWYMWRYGGAELDDLPVIELNLRRRLFWTAVAVTGTIALGYAMSTKTNASYPYWDATTTVLSLIAQYLMAEKILESFLIWISVDVLSIGLYHLKGLTFATGLYAAFLVLATIGYFEWRKSMLEHGETPQAGDSAAR